MAFGLGEICIAKAHGLLVALLLDNSLASMLLMLATCLLVPTLYKRFKIRRCNLDHKPTRRPKRSRPPRRARTGTTTSSPSGSRLAKTPATPFNLPLRNINNLTPSPTTQSTPVNTHHRRSDTLNSTSAISSPGSTKTDEFSSSPMRFQNRARGPRRSKKAFSLSAAGGGLQQIYSRSKQYYDAFLVVDIEGTCKLGSDFNYPNEIIEFPVCILEWQDRSEDGFGSVLEVVDEFRTFVKPTWRPTLSGFCTELTGITQAQVDCSPHFPEVLNDLEAFLVKNGMIEQGTRKRLKKFCWCSDGPFDITHFVVKQCYISQVEMPSWLQSDVLDVRSTVLQYLGSVPPSYLPTLSPEHAIQGGITRRSLNISAQLRVLGLPEFQGRQHSGIDDTRNITKIMIELARRGMCLLPNTAIHLGRRWPWMGRNGEVLEERVAYA